MAYPPTIVSGLADVTQLTIAGMYLYWIDPQAGNVTKMPLAGGAPIPLVAGVGTPTELAVDATNVYWLDQASEELMSMPVAGGPPTVVTPALGFAMDADTLYWGNQSGGVWTIAAQPKVGGAITVLSTSVESAALSLSASYVYANGPTYGEITRIPKAGGAPVTITLPPSGPDGIFFPGVLGFDGTYVYTTGDIDAAIGQADWRLDEATPPNITGFPWGMSVSGLAFDPSWVYFSGRNYDQPAFGGGQVALWRVSCRGSSQGTVIAFFAAPAIAIATDDGPWVYWSDGQNIGRVAK